MIRSSLTICTIPSHILFVPHIPIVCHLKLSSYAINQTIPFLFHTERSGGFTRSALCSITFSLRLWLKSFIQRFILCGQRSVCRCISVREIPVVASGCSAAFIVYFHDWCEMRCNLLNQSQPVYLLKINYIAHLYRKPFKFIHPWILVVGLRVTDLTHESSLKFCPLHSEISL